MIQSMTDQDFYGFTVGNFVFDHANRPVRYTFINRGHQFFTIDMFREIKRNIEKMADLKFSREEMRYLEDFKLFTPEYLDFLGSFRFNPDHVILSREDGQIYMTVQTPTWAEGVMWEMPLLYTTSESYFKDKPVSVTDFIQRTKNKRSLLDNVKFIEFGTRRRRSSNFQDEAIRILKYSPGFLGTSNVHFARLHGVPCLGSQSHQLFSGLSAIYPVEKTNYHVLNLWSEFYKGRLGYALTDTFTTDNFLECFDWKLARIFDGVRQDSGGVYNWMDKILNHYRSIGVNPTTKTLLFSDGLDPEKCMDIKTAIQRQAQVAFGIGTNLTNDVPGEKPLQIVIKLTEINLKIRELGMIKEYDNWVPVCKISDTPSKASGHPLEIERVKKILKL